MRDLNPADFESGALFPLVEVGGSLEVSFQCLGEMKSVGIFSLGGLRERGHWTSPYGEGEAASQGSQRW